MTGEEFGGPEEFAILLSNDEILKPYHRRAVQAIDAIIFRKEFLTLFRRFTIDLQAISSDVLEKGAGKIVKARSRYIVDCV